MFCKKCGAEIADNATFCTSCGAQQETAVAVVNNSVPMSAPVGSKEQEREMLLQQMNGSFQVMTAIKGVEDEIGVLEEQLPVQEKKASGTALAKFIIIGVVLLALFGLGIIIIAVGIILHQSAKKKIAEIRQQMQEKQSELETLKADAALVWLPYNYRNSTSFAMMYGYVTNMRAYYLSDAINLLETELHQARVELMTSISAQASIVAADSARSAANAAGAAAFFSLFK